MQTMIERTYNTPSTPGVKAETTVKPLGMPLAGATRITDADVQVLRQWQQGLWLASCFGVLPICRKDEKATKNTVMQNSAQREARLTSVRILTEFVENSNKGQEGQ